MPQQTLVEFCKTRVALLRRFKASQRPLMMAKGEESFVAAFLTWLSAHGLQDPAATNQVLELLDEADVLSEDCYSTVLEALQNSTSMQELDGTTTARVAIAAMTGGASEALPGSAVRPPAAGSEAQPSPAAPAARPIPAASEVQPRADVVIGPPIANVSKQVNDFLGNYMTEYEWQFFADKNHGHRAKGAGGAKVLARLGIFRGPEGVYAIMSGIILACEGKPVDGQEALPLNRSIKGYLGQLKPTGGLAPETMVFVFPENPMHLPEPWLSKSQQDGPTVPGRLTESTMQLIRNGPQRTSHKTAKGDQGPAAQPRPALKGAGTRPAPGSLP
jgi:hypothetical protein